MKIKTISFGSIVFALYGVFVLAYIFLPNLQYSIKYVHLFLMSFPLVAWVCIGKEKMINIFVCLGFMAFFRLIFNAFGNFSAAVNTSFILYLCLLGYFMFEGSQKLKTNIALNIIVVASLVMICLVAVNTYKEFAANPGVARLLAKGTNDDEEINLLRSMNIGGYGFSYAVGMLIPYVATWIIRAKGNKKWIAIAFFVLLIVYITKTQYTTLLLISVFFTGYVFFIHCKTMHAKIAVFIIVICLIFGSRYIFEFLADQIKLRTLSVRFRDIASMLSGNGSDNSRWELQWNAFKLFFKNPLFGADLTNAENLYIVNHSHTSFSGTIASGGIAGVSLYYGTILLAVKNVKKMVPTCRYIEPTFLHLLVLSLFNPISSFEIFTVTFLIIPGIELILNHKKENYYGE